jgi:hypothetical protein
MAEIEQRPLAVLALVTRDDGSLHPATHRDGVLARGAACEQLAPVRLQPGEEAGIAEQAVFDDFGIAGAELPLGQRVEQRGICQHQHRLMKRADEILAVRGIDCGFAADGRVDLRKQRGGNLHIIETAPHEGSGKTGEIADDPAAERHHDIGALDARGNERFANPLEHGEALRALARRHRHRACANPGSGKGGLRRGEVVACDDFVADDRRLGPRAQCSDFFAQRP